ncbi:MAG: hypothetical protein ABIQ72_16550 [Usitatibacter sp.]
MHPCDPRAICKPEGAPPATPLEKLLRLLSAVTMIMTIPQAVSVWQGHGGTSLVSWTTYLVSSIAWLVYGIQNRDTTIYLTFLGWVVLDVVIVAGVIVRG